MADITIALDRSAVLSLQDQLRRQIVEAISVGVLRPGARLTSSRTLARRLGVSRNTVVLAYEDLVAEGHLDARDRSGIFVSSRPMAGRVVARRSARCAQSPIAERMAAVPTDGGARCPQHWRQYPYPFWDGRIDASLAPLQEWRKAVRLASCPRDAAQWSDGNGEWDDPMLVEEIRTKLLLARGITAVPEEVLVTASARQALQFLATLLIRPGSPVWLEAPVDPELLATLRERGAHIEQLPYCLERVPPEGVVVVTSARSGMASGKRVGPELANTVAHVHGIVIEYDTPADTPETDMLDAALYAGAAHGNVVHVGRVSPVAACGTCPAFVVAEASAIARLRRLRRISGANPDRLLQRAWAYFIALGHYASTLQKSRRILLERHIALRDALNHYLHADVQISTVAGSSAYWVRIRDGRDAHALAARAAQAGALVQPARLDGTRDAFLMGVSSIPAARIREGVHTLARVFRSACSSTETSPATPRVLAPAALQRAIVGKTLLYNTVYGEPCTIRVCRSGTLVGMAGYDNDDPDRGHWWVEKDRWFRQWDHWAYGEAEGYRIAVDGRQLYWYDDAGNLVDKAVILEKQRSRAVAGA